MTQNLLTRSTTRNTDHSGFTLIELAVVTLLIALFAGLTLPLLSGGEHRALRSTSRRISGMTRWCYNEAALSGLEHRLVFDLQRQVFFAQRLESDGELVVLSGPGGCNYYRAWQIQQPDGNGSHLTRWLAGGNGAPS